MNVTPKLKRAAERFVTHMNPPVWLGLAAVVIAFAAFGACFPNTAERTFGKLQGGIVDTFGWFYVLTATILLVFTLWLLSSRFGGVRLGPPDSRPEFRYFTWFSMLLAAGMGIGYYLQKLPATSLYVAPGEAGGLQALRTASLTTGLPMSLFLLTACYGLFRALRKEHPKHPRADHAGEKEPDLKRDPTPPGETAGRGIPRPSGGPLRRNNIQ